jgi:hypothetical protein
MVNAKSASIPTPNAKARNVVERSVVVI